MSLVDADGSTIGSVILAAWRSAPRWAGVIHDPPEPVTGRGEATPPAAPAPVSTPPASEPTCEGGCLCGAVRYRLHAEPFDPGYCHCRLCRRASGAPVLVFASVPRVAFELVCGTPRRYRSSSFGERSFCGDCGTQLYMEVDHDPETVDVTVASLDDPDATPPEFHIWHASRIGWFETRDDLPRFHAARPKQGG
jgi:hypothetical protein